jgi:hypothetical protein
MLRQRSLGPAPPAASPRAAPAARAAPRAPPRASPAATARSPPPPPHQPHHSPRSVAARATLDATVDFEDPLSGPPAPLPGDDALSEVARANLRRAATACRRAGWLGFWVQLVLNTVAAVITLFSMAFSTINGPPVSVYLTLFAIAAGFLSTFWSFGYTRLARRLRRFLDAGAGDAGAPRVRRSDVVATLEKGAIINVLGAGAALLALQATIGLLVAKTLTTAAANPFLASSAQGWNPVLAFDVFNVQATTNALLAHFFSLAAGLWLLRGVANRPSTARVLAKPQAGL